MESNIPNQEKFIIHWKESEFLDAMTSTFFKMLKDFSENSERKKPLELYRREELAILFKCQPQTISDWVKYEGFPKHKKKIGHTLLWLKSDVEDFILKGN